MWNMFPQIKEKNTELLLGVFLCKNDLSDYWTRHTHNMKFNVAQLTKLHEKANSVQIGGKTIWRCWGYHKCWEKRNNRCIFDGADVLNDTFAKALEVDAIALGSPFYFTDVTIETKAFIDRARFVALGALAGVGVAAVTLRRGGATHAFDTMNHLFFMSQMVVPWLYLLKHGFWSGSR